MSRKNRLKAKSYEYKQEKKNVGLFLKIFFHVLNQVNVCWWFDFGLYVFDYIHLFSINIIMQYSFTVLNHNS